MMIRHQLAVLGSTAALALAACDGTVEGNVNAVRIGTPEDLTKVPGGPGGPQLPGASTNKGILPELPGFKPQVAYPAWECQDVGGDPKQGQVYGLEAWRGKPVVVQLMAMW